MKKSYKTFAKLTLTLIFTYYTQTSLADLKLRKLPSQTLPDAAMTQPATAPAAQPAVQPGIALPASKLPVDGSVQLKQNSSSANPAGTPAALSNNGAAQAVKPTGVFGKIKNLAIKTIYLTPQPSWNDIKNEPNSTILIDQKGNQITIGDLKGVIQEARSNSNGGGIKYD